MLKQRILTALVLIPLVVLAILKLPSDYFAVLLFLIIALGAWEWSALSGIKTKRIRMFYVLLLLASAFCIQWFLQDTWKHWIIYASLFCWSLAFVSIISYQFNWFTLPKNILLRSLIGWFVILPSCLSLVLLHEKPVGGAQMVLVLFVLIWIADSAAYFAGRQWGKNKLASRVSPGKSWEGVYAAIFISALAGAVFARLQDDLFLPLIPFSILCLITVLCSIMGDLFESLIKRTAEIKDSGNLLPGHGGILDRIDSLTVAAPVFLVGLYLIGGVS